MRGHIRPRGPQSWAVVLDVGRDGGGKRRQKWHTVRGTKKDAQRELAPGSSLPVFIDLVLPAAHVLIPVRQATRFERQLLLRCICVLHYGELCWNKTKRQQVKE